MSVFQVAILILLGFISLQLVVIAFFLNDGLGRIRSRLRSIDDSAHRAAVVAERFDNSRVVDAVNKAEHHLTNK